MRMVCPVRWFKSRSRPSTIFEFSVSRLPVGSSASKKRRTIHDSASDGDALLFTAGKRARFVIEASLDPQQPDDLFELGIALVAAPRDVACDLNILGRRERRQQVIFLKDKSDSWSCADSCAPHRSF